MNKPNRNSNQEMSQDEIDALETIEYNEFVEGHRPSDLQHDFNF